MERTKQTIGISFFIKKDRLKNGQYPVYTRITVDGERRDFSLKEWVPVNGWDENHGRAKRASPELTRLNSYMEEVRGKIMHEYREIILNNKKVTAELLKRKFFGLDENSKTLLELIDYHNTHMQEKLARGTLKNYYTTKRYVQKFLKEKKKRADIYLSELSYQFLLEFEQFVRSTPLKDFDPCSNNGLMKHMERLKKVANLAVKTEWLSKNPFELYKLSFKKYDRQFLNESELKAIEESTLSHQALDLTRDLFVFSCYTGLAPVDLRKATPGNIITGVDGELWLHTERAKTKTIVNVPLLPQAIRLIEKYSNHPVAQRKGSLFPLPSDQEINRNLKVIAGICHVDKHMTFYLSRHTFATTVTLNNGVPLETVSKMMGHTKFSTTQIYARILNKKIGEDMAVLRKRLLSDAV